MRRKKNIKYQVYNGRMLKQSFENSRLYLLLLLFVIGILVGAIAVRNSNSVIISEIKSVVDSYRILRMQQGFAGNFLFSLIINCFFVASSVFLGFSLIGYPFIMWVPFIRGIGIGAVCGCLYSAHRFSGLGYALLTIYPAAILAVTLIIISCNDSCEYSKNAYLKAIGGKGQFERGETRIFLIRQLVFLGLTVFSSVIDSGFSTLFSSFFSF